MAQNGKKQEKKLKNRNMNVKFTDQDYEELQKIADAIGGMTLSSMIRMLVYSRLERVRKTGDPKQFVDFDKK